MRIANLLALGLVALTAALSLSAAAYGHSTVTVYVGDLWFCGGTTACPQGYNVSIEAGDTVTWQDVKTSVEAIHTVTQCGDSCSGPPAASPLFDSRTDPSDDDDYPPYDIYLDDGETYTFTFDTPGTYRYRCELHPFQMQGVITVQPASHPEPVPTEPPPPAQPSPTPATEAAVAALSPTPVLAAARVPSAGGPPPSGVAALDWIPIAVGLLLAGGVFAVWPRGARR